MRMKLFDKFLLALMLLLLLGLSLFVGCVALSVMPFSAVLEYFDRVLGWWDLNAYIFGGAALLLFIITLRLFVASYSSNKDFNYTRLVITDTGEIAISIPTIKQITAAFISTKSEVVASASDIFPVKDGLLIRLRICMKEGIALPDFSKAVQSELKAHLETVTGLVVKEIRINIDNNRSNYSGKGR